MAFITRLTTLFNADINAVIDRIEEPTLLLKQAVREMRSELQQQQQSLAQQQAHYSQLQQRHKQIQQNIDKTNAEIALCFDNNNASLVKTLLRRRLESQQLSTHLIQQQNQVLHSIEQQKVTLNENTQKLEYMQQQMDVLSQKNHHKVQTTPLFCNTAITNEDIEIAYLKEKQLHDKNRLTP